MQKDKIIYWTATGLLAAMMLMGAIMDLIIPADFAVGIKTLGYSEYTFRIIGVGKLIGLFALLQPSYPRLKEWAYAGFAVDLTGALISHIVVEGVTSHIAPIPVLMICLLTSYYYHCQKTKVSFIAG